MKAAKISSWVTSATYRSHSPKVIICLSRNSKNHRKFCPTCKPDRLDFVMRQKLLFRPAKFSLKSAKFSNLS